MIENILNKDATWYQVKERLEQLSMCAVRKMYQKRDTTFLKFKGKCEQATF